MHLCIQATMHLIKGGKMDFIGQVEGLKFSPISNYNNLLKSNESFDVDSSTEFENILSKQTNQLNDALKIQGSVEMNNFDEIAARNSVQGVENSSPTGKFINDLSNSMGKGLNSANQSIQAADEAQELFATGGNVSVHDVMIAAEKASLNMAMVMQLRNKLITAYNEINGIRV